VRKESVFFVEEAVIARDKKAWSYIPTSLIVFMAYSSVASREIFTFVVDRKVLYYAV
jgi:hypothetical protein